MVTAFLTETNIEKYNKFVNWTANNSFEWVRIFTVNQKDVDTNSTLVKVAKVFFGSILSVIILFISLSVYLCNVPKTPNVNTGRIADID